MAVNITATRSSTLFTDQDLDGQFDPGDVVLTRIRITNSGSDPATGISVTDSLSGVTLVPGSVQVTPIAYDDAFNLTGNTPITINAAQGLLLNDVDPDGAGGNAGLVVSSVDTTGTQGTVAFNANGSFTFTPTTGFVGITSFKYFVTDAQGLGNVTEGIVTMTVTDKVWYVDNTYGGENGASDGSYMKPFTSLTPLNNNGADADGANDTIFVYHNGGNYTAGITLEAGQKLLGDGVGFVVNGHNIGGTERTGGSDNVATNAVISQNSGTVVTLATDNTVRGFTLDSNGAGVVGLADGNTSVTTAAGTLTVNNVSFTGAGQAIDIDAGGNLAVTIDSLTSSGATGQGIQLAGTASSGTGLLSGSVTVNNGAISGAGTGILLGVAGGGTASSGGSLDLTYNGTISGSTTTAVEIEDRTGGTATFSGNITHSGTAGTGIVIDSLAAGTVNFNGPSTSITTTTGTGVSLTNNTGGTINFTPTAGGNGFDVATGAGKGIVFTGGGTLNVTGTLNSVATSTGQLLDFQNGTMGTSGIQFGSLNASGTVTGGNAVNILNIDAAGAGTFQGGAVTVAGTSAASADGINITGSNSTFTFASATIGGGAAGTSPITGDGIEINGTTPNVTGAVTFTTVNVNGAGLNGVNIVGATNAVTISGGNIGATNDPNGDGVNITGGTGAVTVAATVTKNSAGNEVVDISSHATGAIQFSGTILSNSAGGGIRLVNNSSGNIDFTGDVTLNTGTLNALTFTNTGGTGANVTFSEGSLDIDTTSGIGINATNSTVGAGSLTISGATGVGNIITATTGRAINVDGVTMNFTLNEVNVTGGGTTTGVFLKNTGAGGQFIVTGEGSTAGSGGTIANIGGADVGNITGVPAAGTGIYLENVSNVSLSNMIFGATGGTMNNFGIRGNNVTNFTLRDSEFRGTFGTNANFDEATIRFGSQNGADGGTGTTGLKGTALFEGNNIGGGIEDNLSVYVYGSDTLNITVKDSANDQAVFSNTVQNFNDAFYLESGGTSNVTVNVTGVDFNGAKGDLLQVLANGSTTQTIVVQNNNFINAHTAQISGGGGIALTGGGTNINVDYLVDNNVFKGMRSSAIFSSYGGVSGNISGLVTNNKQGTANGSFDVNTAAPPATANVNRGSQEGMFFFGGIDAKQMGSTGNINYALKIDGNTIRDVNGIAGIMLRSNQQDSGGQARTEATISNNTMAEMGPGIAGGIYLIPGGASLNNDKGTIGANISSNNINFTVGGASTTGDAVVFDQAGVPATFYMPGYTSAPSADPNTLANFLKNTKGNVFVNAQVSGTGGVLSNTSAVANQAFVLTVPTAIAAGFSEGWEDFTISPVTAPPRDPDPVPDASGGGDAGGSGGTGGGSGGTGGGSGGTGGGTGGPAPTPADNGTISLADLSSLVDAAIQRWVDAGATQAQIEAMRAVRFGVVDMAGFYVGTSEHGVINIDVDGAGFGWFVDSTPGEDSEFNGSGTRLAADSGGAADGRLDLLTVLMHELGHQIGLDDEYVTSSGDDVMFGYMKVGERRLPADGESNGAVPGSIGSTAFALTPVLVGTLPSNKVVDVYFKATIDQQVDKYISPLMNTATISGNNFSTVLAVENNALDSLTLGSTVYVDANLNGIYDVGEGRTGVALELYADTNDSGGWDPGDVLLGSTTTLANGAYSFTGLAPGDYIVVVTAANFANAAALDDLLIVQGVAADPDNNVDNDNNGVAATGGAVASQTITLAYNTEPTNGTGNDTNNTLDFGFVANQPPVAVDDAPSVAEDSTDNVIDVLGNDTDPEHDSLSVTAVNNPTNGTVTLVGGVVKFTPTANFNGTAGFDYTVSDGNGHTDTGHATVTVTAVNDPVTGAAPLTASLNEDAANVAISGLSISDVDTALAPAGVYDVTLSATHGTLTLTTTTGLTFGTGDGSGDTTMTFHGTLADINAALATAKYTPDSNYAGSAQIQLAVTDTFGGTVATGTGSATDDTDTIAVTVNSINDAPTGADGNTGTPENATYVFDSADFSTGFADASDNPANGFAGIKIASLPTHGTLKLNGADVSVGDTVTLTQLNDGKLTFVPNAGSAGSADPFKFYVMDDGGTASGGVNTATAFNTYTMNIGSGNANPVFQLDDTGPSATLAYTENQPAQAIAPDAQLSDSDSPNFDTGTLTVSFQANGEAADQLGIQNQGTGAGQIGVGAGTVSYENTQIGTFTGGANGANLVVTFDPDATPAAVQALIRAITYHSTSDNPGTGSRTVNFLVSDGDGGSAQANAAVNITAVNDAPSAANANETGTEDVGYVFTSADFNFADSDGNGLARVAITTLPTNGTLYIDLDGPGGNAPVAVQLFGPNSPAYITKSEIDLGHLYYVPTTANAFGDNFDSFNFKVEDNGGTANGGENLSGEYSFTINLAAANDSPVFAATSPVAVTEQVSTYILTGATVSDGDLDAKNSGNGDYAGAVFSVNRNPASNPEDDFELVAGANFTIDGINLKDSANKVFGHISADSNGLIAITFTSLETPATSALVDEVIQSIKYFNTSNNPPASVVLSAGFTDGSPGGGQGGGATGLDNELITVNIAAVNDAPVNALGGTIGTGEDVVAAWLSGMSISDPDADPATDDIVVKFAVGHGTLDIKTDVAGGVTAADVTGDLTGTITVTATLDQINATLAASNGLTYTPTANFNGDDTLTVTTNDQGHNGSDPGLTGNDTSEEDVDTRTISVSASDDPAVAVADNVSTAENTIGTTGDLTANDSDPEGDTFEITEVNGMAVVGTEIVLASGAKLTVNADGTYSYDPNGKYNWLTDNTSGAVNTSATDSFNYTITGGSIATVTVTITGVAGAGDWLMGNSSDNIITGTPQQDLFLLQQGGNDTAYGLASNDIFYFGKAFTGADTVDGDEGRDAVVLQGNYTLTLSATNITEIESISLKSGAFTFYGDTANNRYVYNLTTVDANVAAGQQLIVNGQSLLADENFTFDGSDESDGRFVIFGGHGIDHFTGGDGSDMFVFDGTRWGSDDTVDGGADRDAVIITAGNGTTHIAFGATSLTSIESISVSNENSSTPTALPDYEFVLHDGNVAAGETLIVNGSSLKDPDQTISIDGSAEQDGHLKLYGGAGLDVLTGGKGDDVLVGGGRGDTLTGGAGNDIFRYDSVTDSNKTERDGIQDFNLGDLIDLSRIDANTTQDGDQAFTFIGNANFNHVAGELRFENVSLGGTVWQVSGDTDGDGFSDFEVILMINTPDPITASDFIL